MSFTLTAIIGSLVSCQYDPFAHLYTTLKPAEHDVVGLYRLTNHFLNQADEATLAGKTCLIELRADGTFEATNLPARQIGLALISGSGRWTIETVGSIDFGTSEQDHWGARLQFDGGDVTWVGFMNAKAPYSLIFTIGDPDSGHVLILERSSDDPPRL